MIVFYSYYRKYFINLWLIVIIICIYACGNDGVAVIDEGSRDDKDMGTPHLPSVEYLLTRH